MTYGSNGTLSFHSSLVVSRLRRFQLTAAISSATLPRQDENRGDHKRDGITVAFVRAIAEIDDRPSAQPYAHDDCCDADLVKHPFQG